jgi:hypothetical protein
MKDHLDKLFNELEGDLNAATKGDRAHRNLYALADDLEAQDSKKYAKIIDRCRSGFYHDFATLTAFPKMEMHHDLLAVGLVDVDRRMQEGEFDS